VGGPAHQLSCHPPSARLTLVCSVPGSKSAAWGFFTSGPPGLTF
jgi:hypothetical protein